MKIYISGPISGRDIDEVREEFARASLYIMGQGHTAVSPFDNGLSTDAPYIEHLIADLRLLSECDAIYMLKGWNNSRGAQLELSYAKIYGLRIIVEPFSHEEAAHTNRVMQFASNSMYIEKNEGIIIN